MSISFNQENKIFHLQTKNSSYVFFVSNHLTLEHLYYGKRIHEDDARYISNRQICSFGSYEDEGYRGFTAATVGLEISPFNSGDVRTPSVIFDGLAHVDENRLRYRSHKIYQGRKEIEGLPYSRACEDTKTLEILLTNDEGTIAVTLYYTVYPSVDVIARSQTVENTGKNPLILRKFASMSLDFYDADFDVIALDGMYLYERASVLRTPLRKGVFKNGSLVGTSSHHRNPFFALCEKTADEDKGEVYGFNLVYSGNFSEEVEVDRMGSARVTLGLDDTGFAWTLQAGEHFASPEAVMTYSSQGIGGMSRNFHDHIRASIIEKEFVYAQRPIVINSWEASYFTVSEEIMLSLAQGAKECGIDTVVLDDGWFRNADNAGLGDFSTICEKFPSGLKGLSEKIHALGLKFGIWLEPEMVNPNSDHFRNHPDCLLSTAKKPLIYRNQYVLDLTRDEVVERMVNRIAEELEGVEIDYIKWDCNRYMTEAASSGTAQGEVYHRQMLGTYKLLAALKQRLGNVLFESCSGGGGRFDLGMLFYSPQIWTSDNTDPYARVYIEYGTSVAYPVSTISCHFTEGDCTSGRESTFDFRYRVASFGPYGYEMDLSKHSKEDWAAFKGYSEAYRRMEKLNLEGDLYRLISPESDRFCAYIKVSKDKSRAQFTFLEINATGFIETMVVKLKGLDPDKRYRYEQTGEILHGDTLMNLGIRIGDLYRAKRADGYTADFVAVED